MKSPTKIHLNAGIDHTHITNVTAFPKISFPPGKTHLSGFWIRYTCLLVLSFPCQSDVSVTVTDPTQNYHLPLFLELHLHAQKPYIAS